MRRLAWFAGGFSGGVFLALARLSGEDLSLYPVEYYSDWGCAT